MPECDYCGDEFRNKDTYLDHLETNHADEVGPIDRRRLENRSRTDDGLPRIVYYGAGAMFLLIVIGVVLLGVSALSGEERVHEHGTLIVEINGEQVDFDQPQYHEPDQFHFHPDDGTTWHMHPDRLTFEEAMDELGVPVTETSITIDGTTYDDEDPDTSVTMRINGESADLDQELEDGDRIEIIVETDE